MTRKPRQLGLPYFQNKNLGLTGVVKNIPTSGPTSLAMYIQTDQQKSADWDWDWDFFIVNDTAQYIYIYVCMYVSHRIHGAAIYGVP